MVSNITKQAIFVSAKLRAIILYSDLINKDLVSDIKEPAIFISAKLSAIILYSPH